VKNVMPVLKPLQDAVRKQYLEAREQCPAGGDYEVFERNLRSDVARYRDANVALESEDSLLGQEFQKTAGQMSVKFEGREHTLEEMAKYLDQSDREAREASWKATQSRRLDDCETLDDIFDALIRIRHERARNADFDHFIGYQFDAMHRFDYTPADCAAYHDAIEQHMVPLLEARHRQRRDDLGVDTLRPWDLNVDRFGRPPLQPFSNGDELSAKCEAIFNDVDPGLGGYFTQMRRDGLLDLDSRPGKAPGGFQAPLAEARNAFIFMNAVGIDFDVRVLLHEAGHFFHTMLCREQPLNEYRRYPMEIAEVASFGMEFFAGRYLERIYEDPADAQRSRIAHLEGKIELLCWIATIDAFQNWLYTNPEHTREARIAAWREIRQRFAGKVVDWTGLETEHDYFWQKQIHLFKNPLYYIEYGIAQLGALQLWQRIQVDPADALAKYKAGLVLGGSRPLPELYETMGIRFAFDESIIRPAAEILREGVE
jgi:oligoendopeptidase F